MRLFAARITWIAWLGPILLAMAPAAFADDDAPAPPVTETVEQVLGRMRRAYAEAKSYEDTGENVQAINPGSDPASARTPFVTRYVRPDRWYFECGQTVAPSMPPNHFVAWRDASSAGGKWQMNDQPPVAEKRFPAAAANGAPLSGRAASLIPELLESARIGKPALIQPERRWKLTGSERVDQADCYALQGVDGLEDEFDLRLSIDKQTSLIRRYQLQSNRSENPLTNTVTYQPKLNGAIEPAAFRYPPPRTDKGRTTKARPKAKPTP